VSGERSDRGDRSDPLGTSLLFDVYALNHAVGRLLASAMGDGPLSPGEYAVYSAVFELESATPTVLAARLGMRLTTFMDHLRLMEARGDARRLGHPSDRRSYLVTLTAAGMAAHRAANLQFESAYRAFAARLAGGEAPAKRALAAIRDAADGAFDDTSASFERPPRRSRRFERGSLAGASPRQRVDRAG
jgi:DNA-binding MarR family transcriptional regulator